MEFVGRPPDYEIANALKKLQKDFHSVIQGVQQLKVLTQTKEERLKEMEEMRQHFRKTKDTNDNNSGQK